MNQIIKMAIAVAALFISLAFGQMATGNIGGEVKDSSGAAIQTAKILLEHLSTGAKRDVSTNDRGQFLAPLMPIGEYEVTAEFTGFGNEILLDGISNHTTSNAGAIGRNSVLFTPSVDALEEFKVKSNNFSAESKLRFPYRTLARRRRLGGITSGSLERKSTVTSLTSVSIKS